MSEPARLAPPEKRKDKINKNDIRYLIKIQRGKQRSKRREVLDEEIATEKKSNEKRRRASSGNVEMKRLKQLNKTVNSTATASSSGAGTSGGGKRGKKKIAPEVELLEKSEQVFWKNWSIPCDMSGEEYEAIDEPPMTPDEIAAHDEKAVIWKDAEYGHVISHSNLWVFCNVCHMGMRSTNIGLTVQINLGAKIQEGGTISTFKAFLTPPTVKWMFFHRECIDAYTNRQYNHQ